MNNFFKKIINNTKGLRKSRLMNPHIYWVILVQVFLLMSFILIIFSFYILYEIRNEQIFQFDPNDPDNQPVLVNEKLLKRVLDSSLKKELKSEEIRSNVFSFPDPN